MIVAQKGRGCGVTIALLPQKPAWWEEKKWSFLDVQPDKPADAQT